MKFFNVYEKWYDDTLLRVYPCKNNTDNKTEVKTMDKNKAPYEIEGSYMLTINGNETVITPVGFEDAVYFYKKNRDKSKSYKCHPDDKFDVGWVLNDYFEHKDEIMVTDEVTVVDHGWCYPTARARDWIVTFANTQRELGNTKLANDILLDWGRRLSNYDSGTFRVVDSAVFEQTKEVYLIVNEQNKKYFLVGRKGLKKVQ